MLLRRADTTEIDDHIDMTPMVDVVFQLMTFMLFSIQMTGGEKVDVPPARHGTLVEKKDALLLTILPALSEEAPARIFLADGSTDGDGQPVPEATLEQVRLEVTDAVARGRRRVVIQADGDVAHADVMRLASAVAEVEGVSINFGVQEAPRRQRGGE